MRWVRVVNCTVRAGMCPTLKALYISGYTDDFAVAQGAFSNQITFLQKPLQPLIQRKSYEVH